MNPPLIRPLALCLFRHGDRILVEEGYDPTKRERFYRPLGGGIEFGEYGRDAIVREIREELGVEITNVRYLATLENLFTFDGRPGHEIVLVYDAEFVDRALYDRAELTGTDDGGASVRATWKRLGELQEGRTPVYPDDLLALLA